MHSHPKILLVEDEAIIAISEKATLEKNGFDVIIAHSGEKAVKMIEDGFNPDLILMDINLGKGISGTEAATVILEKHTLPIVFLTSHEEEEFVQKVKNVTRYGYVLKNSGEFVLIESIHMAMELFKANQKTLSEKEYLNITLNAIGDAVIVTDIKGLITRMNPVAEKLTHWTCKKAVGQPLTSVFRIVNAKTRKKCVNPVEKVLRTGKMTALAEDTLLIDKDCKEYQIADSGAPIRDHEGNIIGVVLVFRDVTHEYQIQKTLRESKEQLKKNVLELQAIINALPGLVSVVDRDFNVVVANQAVAKQFGQSDINEILNKKCYRIRKKRTSICPQCGLKKAMETGKPVSRFSTPEEEKLIGIAAKTFAIPLKDEKGGIWGGVEVIMDITDLKQTESALAESENRFRSLIEQATDAMFLSDMNGRFIEVNHRTCESLGYTREELLQLKVKDVDARYNSTAKCKSLWNKMQPSEPVLVQTAFIRKDGSPFPVEVNIGRTIINGREAILGFARDITERIIIEQKLKLTQFGIDHSQISVFQVSDDGDIVYANIHACRALGYTWEELGSMKIWEIDPRMNAEKWLVHRKRTRRQVSSVIETIHRRKDGTTFPVEVAIDFLDYEGKKVSFSFAKDISERKFSENAVRESEEKYRMLFHCASDIILVHNYTKEGLPGRILDANDRALHVLGYSREELLNLTIRDIIDKNEIQHIKNQSRELFHKKESLFYRTLYSKDGKGVEVEVHSRMFDFRGESTTLSVCRDITERKAAEEKLKLFQFSLDHASIGVFGIESTSKIFYVNQYVSDYLGYSRDELLNMTISEIDPDFNDEDYRARWKQLKKAGSSHLESSHLHKNGTRIPVEINSNDIEFEGKEMTFAFTKPIAERKDAEEKLKRTQRLFLSVVAQTPIPMAISDPDGQIITFNPACRDFLGISPDSEIRPGTNLFDIRSTWKHVNEDGLEIPDSETPLAQSLRGIETKNRIWKLIRDDGTERWSSIYATPIYDEKGEIIAGFVAFPDITEQKTAQDSEKKLLEEKQLILREIHHHIKNDMNTVQSLLSLQAMSAKNPEVAATLQEAKQRILLMRNIYSQLYQGDDFTTINLKRFIENLIQSIRTAYATAGQVRIGMKIDHIIIPSRLAFHVGIIINELVTNAFKYAFQSNDAALHIRLYKPSADKLCIIVEDNGTGLPKNVADGSGYGFGLTLVSSLLEQHDGEMSVQVKNGTRFNISIHID